MVVTCGHSKCHLEFPHFLNNGANFVVCDSNHHVIQPPCLSACSFSNVPALSQLLALTHAILSPSTAISPLPNVFPNYAHSSRSGLNLSGTFPDTAGAISDFPSIFPR